ncbi:S-adenosyl-L-methionine-dependent methyltransferase [Sesbania bispinosa]|nr:S-adenosyl-L-methionine-dependent methyltransferase [Sesbania bispinosa]
MTHFGFFSQKTFAENELEVEYALTDSSTLLLKNHPLSVTPFLNAIINPIFINPWHQWSTWLKNDDPTAFQTTHGMSFWEYANREPIYNNLFNDGMESDARLVISVVMEKCNEVFNGVESLVDVGGGTGTMAKVIAKSFPKMECIVFDLPHVVTGLEGSENLKYVSGDMFKAIPPADTILLKWIMHEWNDEECLKILKKCKEAMKIKGKEGKVIIIDMVMDNGMEDDESVETQFFFDMMTMVMLNGKERNKKEWDKLISSAGFKDFKITPSLGLRYLIEIYP